MKKQILVVLGLIFSVSGLAAAQTKTVTNADLEKFRQKRLAAEREYRENYKRLGLPSPEELEKKRIQDEKDLIEYARELRLQRLEREAAELEAEVRALQAQNEYLQAQSYDSNYGSNSYIIGYLPYYYGFYNNYRPGFYNRYRYGAGRFYRGNRLPPIRPPRPIRPPGVLRQHSRNFTNPRVIKPNRPNRRR